MSAPYLQEPALGRRTALLLAFLAALPGCTALGSAMSPYSEKFSCKNSDHGQCIHPEAAYADAVAGRRSRSDPNVTNGRDKARPRATLQSGTKANSGAYAGYRTAVYQELRGLVDAPVTPMLRPGRTVRTLILPYADRERPDRLYMPRYIYSILDRPQWVVGDYLVGEGAPTARVPILEQSKAKSPLTPQDDIAAPPPGEAQAREQRP